MASVDDTTRLAAGQCYRTPPLWPAAPFIERPRQD